MSEGKLTRGAALLRRVFAWGFKTWIAIRLMLAPTMYCFGFVWNGKRWEW